MWERKEFNAAVKLKELLPRLRVGAVNGAMHFSSFPFPAAAGGGVSQKEAAHSQHVAS